MKIDLFEAGKGGFTLYRIPGIVVTSRGTVLTFCEARRDSGSDWDYTQILMCRSTDSGRSFSPPRSIAKADGPIAPNPLARRKGAKPDTVTYHNAAAIAARDGTVHLLFCVEYMRCFYQRSTDDGETFSQPVETTSTFDRFRPEYDWKVLATGPGHGIELRSGRLVVPVWLSTGTGGNAHRPSVAATIYSDDGGQSWQRGAIVIPCTDEFVNPSEATVLELADGRVMFNGRTESPPNRRVVAYSPNGASDWTEPEFHDALLDPVCMASMARLSLSPPADNNRILFSNPYNLERADAKVAPGKSRDRKNLSLQMSYDEGATWPVRKTLEPGFSAYSDLAVLPDGTILCFYERGKADGKSTRPTSYHYLTLARIDPAWLNDGKD
ncbi:MAG: sialidase family protein [Planctomycetota bacterium]